MASKRKPVDKLFLSTTIFLILTGLFVFSSASLGLLAREGITFSAVILNQLFGLFVGTIAMVVAMYIPPSFIHKYALHLFGAAALLTLLVYIPGVGSTHGGASRWIDLGAVTLQPAEALKIGFIFAFAAWIAATKQYIRTWKLGVVPLCFLLGICALLLVFQPDLGTFLVIAGTAMGMFIAGGGKWTHVATITGGAAGALLILGFTFDYVQRRLMTFLDPAADALGAGYQIQQSLIAIGSGQWTGRGFGQSVQKFNFLPEPVGDSIFAVFAEEWGFIGACFLIALFVAFALRGFKIAGGATTVFGSMTTVGIILMITIQSFINIAAMLGIFPLTGMPLLFVSQGGTALMIAMGAVGVVLSISRNERKRS